MYARPNAIVATPAVSGRVARARRGRPLPCIPVPRHTPAITCAIGTTSRGAASGLLGTDLDPSTMLDSHPVHALKHAPARLDSPTTRYASTAASPVMAGGHDACRPSRAAAAIRCPLQEQDSEQSARRGARAQRREAQPAGTAGCVQAAASTLAKSIPATIAV